MTGNLLTVRVVNNVGFLKEGKMSNYSCVECGYEIVPNDCGKCGSVLEYTTITKDDGSNVNVSECPKGCGRIKSPMCHGQDMVVVS